MPPLNSDAVKYPGAGLHLILLSSVLLLAGCAGPVSQPPRSGLQETQTAAQAPDPVVIKEAERLRSLLAAAVPQRTSCDAANAASWIVPARAALATNWAPIDRPQLLVVIDRNPHRQDLCILLAQPDGTWQAIGGSKVSTGRSGRRGYFITPTGVFRHGSAIVDYRAEGTFNENHIRGLGRAGMRVWDFGWQSAVKGWTTDQDQGEIRLLLHATDPDRLERRLGRADSKGCVRIPAVMNRFLDHYGVLDAAYQQAADARIAAVLPQDREPTILAGDTMIVIDSSESGQSHQPPDQRHR